jgi:hypothetical protein
MYARSYVGTGILTGLCFFVLINPYSSNNNFDLPLTMFSAIMAMSGLILLAALNARFNDNKNIAPLCKISLLTVIFSLIALAASRSISIVHNFGLPLQLIALFFFFTTVKQLSERI